ncbi:SpoIID/LytB domain-containing protein [Ruminococcus flavefaciens]|uniref:SpoIID/LytB domain-containing protein n=1 Tax=Ruminococcus flavefaciens TaxID=1265 RepID=UPI0026EE6DF9|nr:SpoIID/LytB domain-containing protein [Ruminococcus flavefaciens]
MNTGLTDEEELTIAHEPAGDTLKVVSEIVNREVGGSFSYEAIKAQAVAVYTYIKYNGDDSKDLRGKPNPPQIVIDACEEVLGEALYYDDNYALTVFSASSGGCSANCYEVFYADYPYLRSVPSDYDAAFDPHWGTVTYMSAEVVRKKLETAYNITLSDDPGNWIQPVYSDETGYVTDVLIDGQTYAKGYPFSMMMGLKSSKFSLTYTYD